MNNPFEKIDSRLSNIESLLLDLKHSSSIPMNEEQDIITIEVVMQITNLARPTIYGLVFERKIPFIKRPNSRKLYFSKSAIIAWLKTGR